MVTMACSRWVGQRVIYAFLETPMKLYRIGIVQHELRRRGKGLGAASWLRVALALLAIFALVGTSGERMAPANTFQIDGEAHGYRVAPSGGSPSMCEIYELGFTPSYGDYNNAYVTDSYLASGAYFGFEETVTIHSNGTVDVFHACNNASNSFGYSTDVPNPTGAFDCHFQVTFFPLGEIYNYDFDCYPAFYPEETYTGSGQWLGEAPIFDDSGDYIVDITGWIILDASPSFNRDAYAQWEFYLQ